MKVETIETPIYSSSNAETKFGIEINAKAFEILTGGIYKNKIAAIVREISANAYDSHVSAGKADVPFKVVLPNDLHPYFEVEDYGIGLDDNEIRTIYTVLFKSTKQNSNDDIGAFGLGSKTPITYTHSFNVRSRKNGIERNYTCYKGADGAPCINLMSEQQTSEQNGVKVSVPVVKSDFQYFYNEAAFILSFFKTRPIVRAPTFEFDFKEEDVNRIYKQSASVLRVDRITSELYAGHKAFVAMGGVCYPIDSYQFSSCLYRQYDTIHSDEEVDSARVFFSNRIHRSNGVALFVNFDLGAFTLSEIAASRESLSITEETRRKICEQTVSSVLRMIALEQEEINQCKTLPEAFCVLKQRGEIDHFSMSSLTFKGKTLSDFYSKALSKKISFFTREYSYRQRIERYDAKISTIVNLKKFTVVITNKNDHSKVGRDKFCRDHVQYNSPTLLFLNTSEKAVELYLTKFGYAKDVDYELENFTEYREEQKKEAAERRKLARQLNKQSNTTNRTKSKETQIYSRAFRFKDSKNGGLSPRFFDVNDTSGVEYYYADEHDSILKSGWFHGVYLPTVYTEIGYEKEVILLCKNSRTEKKIELNNIQHYHAFIERIQTDAFAYCEQALLYQSISIQGVWNDEFKFTISLIENSTTIKDTFYDEITYLHTKINKEDFNAKMFRYFYDDSNIISTDTSALLLKSKTYKEDFQKLTANNVIEVSKEDYVKFKQSTIEKYPLIKAYFSSAYHIDTNDVLNYIKMIDKTTDVVV